MFYLNRAVELDKDLLYKMISKFRLSVQPKLQSYKDYYDGNQVILNKSYSDSTKPCNKTVVNYCKNIADSYCGYLASPNYISYSSEEDIEEVMNILNYNDFQSQDSSFLLNALVYGVATELMYLDNEGQVRFRQINPLQCFAVYDDSLTSDLLYFVRIYKENEWDNSNKYNVDVYGDYSVKHYSMSGENGYIEFIDEELHYFGQCPANIFYLQDERSIFDCILSGQDSINELLSSEIDDYSAFCDAYLALTGVDATSEDVVSMKENRVLLLPVDSKAEWVTKSANDVQIENILKRLHDSIYRIAQCPDFSSESFVGGVSSGIALRYRLTGMETRAASIAAEMKKALQRRVEIICGIASLKLGEEVFRDIKINFKRNIPIDTNEITTLVNALKGTVSDRTLLGMIPNVINVEDELEALKAQKKENLEIYSFGVPQENE